MRVAALPRPLLLRANQVLRRMAYSSRLLTRAAFGVRLTMTTPPVSFWELGSLAMMHALKGQLRDGMRVVDVGTGPYAIMALWAMRRWRLDVVATEIEPAWCAWARRMATANEQSLDVVCCDLLEGVTGPFDAACFVPPFIPEDSFSRSPALLGVSDPRQRELLWRRSCGGPLGWETLDRFYAMVGPLLRPGASTFVSVNHYHISPETIEERATHHGLAVRERLPLSYLPLTVVVASRRSQQ